MADTPTTPKSGRATLRRSAQTSPRSIRPAPEYARAFMLRLARRLADRANVKRARRTEDSAQRVARLAPAAGFLGRYLANAQWPAGPCPWHSPQPWCDGSLDQAWQALSAGDPHQAIKMLRVAVDQLRDPSIAVSNTARLHMAMAIRTTRLMMANPKRCPSPLPVGAPALSMLSPGDLAALLPTLDVLLADFQPEYLSGPDADVWGLAA